MKFHVGQKLWFVHKHGATFEIEVTNVGRKWLKCNRRQYQIDIATLTVRSGGEPCGRCYLDRETWQAEHRHQLLCQRFATGLNYIVIRDLPIEDIRAAAKLLKIDLGET